MTGCHGLAANFSNFARRPEQGMRRQKKFYAWGYADEDLTREEILPWEAGIARHYGLSDFDVTPPPAAEEIALRAPRVAVPDVLQPIVRSDQPDPAGTQLRKGLVRRLPHVHALGPQSAGRGGLPRE